MGNIKHSKWALNNNELIDGVQVVLVFDSQEI